jgi:hypothetical protein
MPRYSPPRRCLRTCIARFGSSNRGGRSCCMRRSCSSRSPYQRTIVHTLSPSQGKCICCSGTTNRWGIECRMRRNCQNLSWCLRTFVRTSAATCRRMRRCRFGNCRSRNGCHRSRNCPGPSSGHCIGHRRAWRTPPGARERLPRSWPRHHRVRHCRGSRSARYPHRVEPTHPGRLRGPGIPRWRRTPTRTPPTPKRGEWPTFASRFPQAMARHFASQATYIADIPAELSQQGYTAPSPRPAPFRELSQR